MIKRELSIFFIVGVLTVAIDFSIYRGINYLGLDSVSIAKGLGFAGGTLFAYFSNRFWTFKERDARPGSLGRFAIVYLISLAANILVNYLGILVLSHFFKLIDYQNAIFFAFLFATGVSASLNFLGLKLFVFTGHPITSTSSIN